ncbi:hypothetical protein FHX75_111407 [Micromonospora palomenae]|uniref:Uncharacterized protein n=1 Tax=Micromonospora palomenae TaxID=1461247 RepID=A0A561WWL0_9ACTN|nr:hypothetical protein FHX75_111407 [Micromonospora palomenae]
MFELMKFPCCLQPVDDVLEPSFGLRGLGGDLDQEGPTSPLGRNIDAQIAGFPLLCLDVSYVWHFAEKFPDKPLKLPALDIIATCHGPPVPPLAGPKVP